MLRLTVAAIAAACLLMLGFETTAAAGEVFVPWPDNPGCASTPAPPDPTTSVTCTNASTSATPPDNSSVATADFPGGLATFSTGGIAAFTTVVTPAAYGTYGAFLVSTGDRWVGCSRSWFGVDINADMTPDFTYEVTGISEGHFDIDGVAVFERFSWLSTPIPSGGLNVSHLIRLSIGYAGSNVFNVGCRIDVTQSSASSNLASNEIGVASIASVNVGLANQFGVLGAPINAASGTFSAFNISEAASLLIDPSGYVYESPNTADRIPGAIVTLERWNGSSWVEMDPVADAADMDPDFNPQITDSTGRYGWDVVAGDYRVKVAHIGCTPVTSGSVTIPPPVTDLDIGMTCTDADGDGIKDWRETNSLYYLDASNTGTDPAKADTDADGLNDGVEVGGPTNPLDPDTDDDAVNDGPDNCKLLANNGQQNADNDVGNGRFGMSSLVDDTVPNAANDGEGDACETDGDADNDGIADGSDGDPGGDVTYDDDNDGNPAMGCLGGTDTDVGEDGPSWDTDCNGIRDGLTPGFCAGLSMTADADGDRVPERAEVCKWGTSDGDTDSDGDGLTDCLEIIDVNGDNAKTFLGDLVPYAKAVQLPGGSFGKDGDFDFNGDDALLFLSDLIPVAKLVQIMSPMPGGCATTPAAPNP